MDYIFQIDHWTDERRIVATYVDADAPLGARDFEPITFSSQDLDAYPLEGLVVSRLDTLVALYTGSDPAKLLKELSIRAVPSSLHHSQRLQVGSPTFTPNVGLSLCIDVHLYNPPSVHSDRTTRSGS